MKYLALCSMCAVCLVLGGCGVSSEEDIQQWMQSERTQAKPRIKPISAPKQFTPTPYTNVAAVEPFSNLKLTQPLQRNASRTLTSGSLIESQLNRRKQPLEAFPLDSMSLVGSLIKNDHPVALIQVDSLLYQVQPGDYLGQNYGRVTKVNETEVILKEIVQDAAGEWVERVATLQLKEASK